MTPGGRPLKLVSAETARALDSRASASWGLDPFALVEAAGRNCAEVFTLRAPGLFTGRPRITAAAGSGNNGADAMVMLRALILRDRVFPAASAVVINRLPGEDERNPRSEALRSLRAVGVPVFVWNGNPSVFETADIIIDGIAGTGLRGPLGGAALEMAEALNGTGSPFIVSIDVPSGNFDLWEPPMPMVKADMTLAVEPGKEALYAPGARVYGGLIAEVGGIFPPALVDSFGGSELITWETARNRLPPVEPAAYKYSRGVTEIRAGSMGASGAARIAARGAQAAGAGLVRLVVDEALYPIIAPSAGGVMVVPAEQGDAQDRFIPDAVLLGPGWGRGPERLPVLLDALAREKQGLPLVLDADAIFLAKDYRFHGNTILTPHGGEFAAYTGMPKEAALNHPLPVLTGIAREKRATILFKSHVLIIAAEDGRAGFVDGMAPVLGAGGTGDLLAGICAALAARTRKAGAYDGYTCAAAAAALLIKSAESADTFIDPLELGDKAAGLAGAAWL
jgi:NAD(P)H-hydrate epimerase